jgi:hypothetical protein
MPMRYFCLKKNWRRVKRHLDNPDLNALLVREMNKYTFGRWLDPFKLGDYPADHDSCAWRFEARRQPAFWRYACHSACHLLVNWALELAQLVEPGREWRIVSSQKHSTVWDGGETLFDINFQALGIEPDECWELARKQRDSRVLGPGKRKRTYVTDHFAADLDDRYVASLLGNAAGRGHFANVRQKALDSGLSPLEALEMEARMAELERIWQTLRAAA